jgi:hypothetical protein
MSELIDTEDFHKTVPLERASQFMRKILSALVLILGLAAAPVAAHASSVTYDLLLTNIAGNVAGGTGSLTVDAQPGVFSVFTQGGAAGSALTALSFNIGGDLFTLADSAGGANAVFLNSNLFNIQYLGTLANNNKVTISLAANGLLYTFYDQLNGSISNGFISISTAAAPLETAHAPEPSTLLLFGTGVLSMAGVARRKFAA